MFYIYVCELTLLEHRMDDLSVFENSEVLQQDRLQAGHLIFISLWSHHNVYRGSGTWFNIGWKQQNFTVRFHLNIKNNDNEITFWHAVHQKNQISDFLPCLNCVGVAVDKRTGETDEEGLAGLSPTWISRASCDTKEPQSINTFKTSTVQTTEPSKSASKIWHPMPFEEICIASVKTQPPSSLILGRSLEEAPHPDTIK